VPQAERSVRLVVQGFFTHSDFVYDGETDAYRGPAGEALRPTRN
jgi:hypothetical protein